MKWSPETFIAWEKLRVVFLLILTVVSLRGLAPIRTMLHPLEWTAIGFGAVLLNILFLLGPVTESIVNLRGFKHYILRCCLFVSGTTATVLVVMFIIGQFHEIHIGV